MKSELIEKAIGNCNGTKKSIDEAVNVILMEDAHVKIGDTVASVDDDLSMGGFVGKGRIVGFSENKSWAEVEAPNGTKFQCQTSLLYLA